MCIDINGEKANCKNHVNESDHVDSNVIYVDNAIVPLEINVTSNVVNIETICYDKENRNVYGMTCIDSRESNVEIAYENYNMNIRNIGISDVNFTEVKTV